LFFSRLKSNPNKNTRNEFLIKHNDRF
jgi:hypothetical protein